MTPGASRRPSRPSAGVEEHRRSVTAAHSVQALMSPRARRSASNAGSSLRQCSTATGEIPARLAARDTVLPWRTKSSTSSFIWSVRLTLLLSLFTALPFPHAGCLGPAVSMAPSHWPGRATQGAPVQAWGMKVIVLWNGPRFNTRCAPRGGRWWD